MSMSGDLAVLLSAAQSVRGGRGALVMDLEGVPIEQASREPGADPGSLGGEYTVLLREARVLAAALGWGEARTFGVRARERRVVFAFAPHELMVGVEAGPTGLPGQMRHAASRAAARLDHI